jgi:hypothetical protein
MITIQYFAGFETTVLWACAYILVDINNISNMEMISHLFGACGENPSLIYMIGLGQLFITIKDYTIIGYNIF